MTWPISMLFKINDMTWYILCVEIYIINIGQCHNIFNVLYVVRSALNTVCVLYIYWNITQRDAGNQMYSFSMWLYYMFYGFRCSLHAFFFFDLFFLLSCLIFCYLAFFSSLSLPYFLACLFFHFSWKRLMSFEKKNKNQIWQISADQFSFSCAPNPSNSKLSTGVNYV